MKLNHDVDATGEVTSGTTIIRAGCSCGSVLVIESDLSMQSLKVHKDWRAAHDAQGHHGVMPEKARRIRWNNERRAARRRRNAWRAER